MTDSEWNNQADATAGAIDAHNQATEDTRRKAANAYARSVNLIDDQQDLINEYRGQGLQQMRAIQGYVDGNRKDWEETQKAIDAIADQEGAGGITRNQFLGLLASTGAAAAGGSFLAGIWPFGGGSGDPGPVYLGRDSFEEAYGELNDADQMSIFSDAVYEEMFDGEGRDLVGAYFDLNPSDDQTDSSFKYFFAEEIDDYMVENENGEMEVDYSQLEEEDPDIRSTSWLNTDDSIAETFEKYGTRNKEQVPDLLEGGLE